MVCNSTTFTRRASAEIPNHRGFRRGSGPEGRQRGFCPALLNEPHQGIQQDHRNNYNRFVRERRCTFHEPYKEGDTRGDQQQNHQRIVELRKEATPGGHHNFGGQLVRAILAQAISSNRGRETRNQVRYRAFMRTEPRHVPPPSAWQLS